MIVEHHIICRTLNDSDSEVFMDDMDVDLDDDSMLDNVITLVVCNKLAL